MINFLIVYFNPNDDTDTGTYQCTVEANSRDEAEAAWLNPENRRFVQRIGEQDGEPFYDVNSEEYILSNEQIS